MYVIKKKWLIVACCILAAGVICAIVIGCTFGRSAIGASTGITVVLDAGHGGIDAGAVGVTGTKESDINLAVAKQLKKNLAASGVNVVMTRTDSDGLYGLPNNGFKRRDMEKRKSIIADTKPDLVISIHMNKCEIPSRKGAQVFYAKGSASAKELAFTIQNSLNTGLESPRKYEALTGDYFMLNCSSYTSVIVECGFLSNQAEEKLLTTESYQQKLAYYIFEGTMSYLSRNSAYGQNAEQTV